MPTLIDLFCGQGGWSRPARAAGWKCIGYDIADLGYPGELVIRSLPIGVEELMMRSPDLVVASPPCDEYARRHLPWIARQGPIDERLLRWSIGLCGRVNCPVIVECSRFSAREVPGARLVGSYALWGDVPIIMPQVPGEKERRSGTNAARRARIPDSLAGWIIEVRERSLERLHFALKGDRKELRIWNG